MVHNPGTDAHAITLTDAHLAVSAGAARVAAGTMAVCRRDPQSNKADCVAKARVALAAAGGQAAWFNNKTKNWPARMKPY